MSEQKKSNKGVMSFLSKEYKYENLIIAFFSLVAIVLGALIISKAIEICVSLDKLDKIGFDGVSKELVENGYEPEKVEKLMKIFEGLKNAKTNEEKFELLKANGVSAEVVESLKLIIETTMKFKIGDFNVVYDATIIRGQGYYTGTVFEVYDEEFGRALGGGGRYDKMVEKFLGRSREGKKLSAREVGHV